MLLRWVRALARIPAVRQNSGLAGVFSGPNLFSLAKARNDGNRGSHGGIAYEFRGMANFEEGSQASIIGGLDLRSCRCGEGVARTKVCKTMLRPNSDSARKLGLY